MRKPYLFTFWQSADGEKPPGYIALCLKSQKKFAAQFEHVRLDSSNVKEWASELNITPEQIILKSDGKSRNVAMRRIAVYTAILRVYLLRTYGGLWLDSDVCILNNFSEVAEALCDFEFVGAYSGQKNKLANCFLGAQKNSQLMQAYWQCICTRISEGGALGWGELGFRMLSSLFDGQKTCAKIYDYQRIIGVPAAQSKQILFDENLPVSDILREGALSFTLFNNSIPSEVASLSESEFLSSRFLMARVMRKVLQREEIAQEKL